VSGIFGVVSRDDCSSLLMYGTDYHSHMGTEYGGVAILGEEFYRQIHNISHSQFKSKFFEDPRRMKGNKGIGVISDSNEQPMYVNSRFGPFCIVTSGLIDTLDHRLDSPGRGPAADRGRVGGGEDDLHRKRSCGRYKPGFLENRGILFHAGT